MNQIILFDGDCNLCDKSVQFIIKHDTKALFKFASLQSDVGRSFIEQHNIPKGLNSLILIEKDKWYAKSSAALRVCKHLNYLWKIFYLLLIIPKPMRDYLYHLLAKNRYQWFGRKDSCILPSPMMKKRFL